MVPVWLLGLLLFLQALSFVLISVSQMYFGNKASSRTQNNVEEVLDRFLARKIEDIQMNKMISSIGIEQPDNIIEDEGDPSSGMSGDEIKDVLAQTEADIAAAEEAGLRTV